MADATELALRALRHRDRSRRDLDERLERAGIPTDERTEALDHLAAAGLLSDRRFADERARTLARRNGSDAQIHGELRRNGVPEDVVADVLAELEPEADRAARIFHQRGGGERAFRYLAGKGFARESLDSLGDANAVD